MWWHGTHMLGLLVLGSAVHSLDARDGRPAHRAPALARRRCEQDGAAVATDAQVVAGADDVVLRPVHAHLA